PGLRAGLRPVPAREGAHLRAALALSRHRVPGLRLAHGHAVQGHRRQPRPALLPDGLGLPAVSRVPQPRVPEAEGLMTPKTRQRLFSAAGAVVVAGILAALNVLSRYVYYRADLSEGKIYSLSDASKGLLQRLDDPVIVTAYFSPALPP